MIVFKEAINCYTIDDIKLNIDFEEVLWKAGRKLPRLVASGNISENYIIQDISESIFNYLITNGYFIQFHDNYWCNLYVNNKHYTPYHRDNYDCDLITLSIGATRTFLTKNDETENVTSYELSHGDIVMWRSEWNMNNTHSIKKEKEFCGERISILFFCTIQEIN